MKFQSCGVLEFCVSPTDEGKHLSGFSTAKVEISQAAAAKGEFF